MESVASMISAMLAAVYNLRSRAFSSGKKEELSSTMLYMCIHAKFFPKDVGYA
jgi:hypothetical protein